MGSAMVANLLPSLIFIAVANFIAKLKFSSKTCIISICFLFVLKLSIDIQSMEPNYYEMLNVPRLASVVEMRQGLRKASLQHHPDKTDDGTFLELREAYDVLMDEQKRDVYNRFGAEPLLDKKNAHSDSSLWDPRVDELNVIVQMGSTYLLWAIIVFISTFPLEYRVCRTWIAVLLIGMAGLEFMLKLSDLTLPPLIATHSYYTEYECVCLVHALFPGCLVLLQHVASAHYVDIDKYTLEAIEELTKHQLGLQRLLDQLYQRTIDKQNLGVMDTSHPNTEQLEDIRAIQRQLNASMSVSHDLISKLDKVNGPQSTGDPFANYYWILFIVLYVFFSSPNDEMT